MIALAERLSSHSATVNTLIASLDKVLSNPHDERFRRVNPRNKAFAANVSSVPGGVEFLKLVGYEELHGHLVLQRLDVARLQTGRAALESCRDSVAYGRSREARQLSQALSASSSEFLAEFRKRKAAFASRVPDEPEEGAMGSALVCFHVEGTDAKIWRRFDSCCTLEDLL